MWDNGLMFKVNEERLKKTKQRMGKKYRYFTVNKKAHGKCLISSNFNMIVLITVCTEFIEVLRSLGFYLMSS